MNSKQLTPVKAAESLGIRLDYLYMLLRSGKIRARKEDGKWLIPIQELDARRQRQRTCQKK